MSTAPPGLRRMPDTLLILAAIVLLAWLIQGFVSPGYFAELDAQGRLVAGSYVALEAPGSLSLFSRDGPGLINVLFEGLVSGGRNSAAVGLVAFLLITGGAFGIIQRSGAMARLLGRVLGGRSDRPGRDLLVPALFVGFSLMGAVFGMSEETIVFALILVPALLRAGYDSITGLLVVYVSTQIGFATSWMNPFSVIVAQSIAGVPVMSGLGFRIILWCVFTVLAAVFVWHYAARVRRHPEASLAFASDQVFRSELADQADDAGPVHTGDWLILTILLGGVAWIAWGVVTQGYYLPEIAGQFLSIGVLAGIVAVLSPRHDMGANDAAAAFRDGATALLPAVLVVGLAKGVVWVLGGDQPDEPSVLNTMLHGMSGWVGALSGYTAAGVMYLLQSLINLFVVSGSGQAALTMPLMAPLADLAGLSRQIAVLAFQLGDGFTNIIVPASAPLMGCLAAARLDWTLWVRFLWRYLLVLMAMALGAVLIAVWSGLS